jgi:hypothetical protein
VPCPLRCTPPPPPPPPGVGASVVDWWPCHAVCAHTTGWAYSLDEPKRRAISIKRTYADNFKYEAGKLRIVKTK